MEIRLLKLIGLGILVFVITNIDNFLLLLLFFGNRSYSIREIVLGQYIGISLLIFISGILSLVSLIISPAWIGLMGFIPIFIGLRQLLKLGSNRYNNNFIEKLIQKSKNKFFGQYQSKILTVSIVTFSNGGDNLAVYVPLFAIHTFGQVLLFIAVFLFITSVCCFVTFYIANFTYAVGKIKRYGHIVLPFGLIGLGVWILSKSVLF